MRALVAQARGESSSTASASLIVFGRDGRAERSSDQLDERLADQARLTRAGDPSDCGHHAERDRAIDLLQIVA
jgi:hypothetical protein